VDAGCVVVDLGVLETLPPSTAAVAGKLLVIFVCRKLVRPSTTVVTLEISVMARPTLANSSPTSEFKALMDPFMDTNEAFKLCNHKKYNNKKYSMIQLCVSSF